jgi:hypothetical protein
VTAPNKSYADRFTYRRGWSPLEIRQVGDSSYVDGLADAGEEMPEELRMLFGRDRQIATVVVIRAEPAGWDVYNRVGDLTPPKGN